MSETPATGPSRATEEAEAAAVEPPATNREQWLMHAVEAVAPLFAAIGYELPPVRISVGWPGGRSPRKVNGQCWSGKSTEDGIGQIFISPTLGADPVKMLAVIVHELVHAIDFLDGDSKHGHGKEFGAISGPVGLDKPRTQSVPTEALAKKLAIISEQLGPYPHSPIELGSGGAAGPKQSTRMLKLVASTCCNYSVRTTRMWIEDQGRPMCPHGAEMEPK